MRPLALLFGVFILFWNSLSAAPVSLKELEFLVRQRAAEDEIIGEVALRQLAEKPTAAVLDKLIASGASQRFITRIQAPELVAPESKTPPASAAQPPQPPAEAIGIPVPPVGHRLPSPSPPSPKPRPGTVAAALDGKVFLENANNLTEFNLSLGGEPKAYLLFFTRADDLASRKFISVVRGYLNQWMAEPRRLEICRARDRNILVRHAIGRKALWHLSRYEELDPRIQALCPTPETRIVLITQDWEVLVNEVAPPAEMAMNKVRTVLNDRFKIQLR